METVEMIVLRLAVEFGAPPIFCPDDDRMGHIEVDELPISEALKSTLKLWNDEYQALYNPDFPQYSREFSPQFSADHAERGESISKILQLELGGSYRVEYQR